MKTIAAILMAMSSGVLLSVGFPPFDLSFLAWVSLVPLFLVITGRHPVHAFLLSLVSGMFFFPIIFIWILEVPNYKLVHHLLLGLILAVYFGLFGLAFAAISRWWGATPAFFAAPFVWVLLEYIRSNFFFLALPWGLLAHSQYTVLPIVQIASITGAYGVSFLIVMVNSAIASLILFMVYRLKKNKPAFETPVSKQGSAAVVVSALILLGLTLVYGYFCVSRPITGDAVKISVVQGNIAQSEKWDRKYAKYIMRTYTDLTHEVSKDRPALIVWPELATPGAISQDLNLSDQIRNISNDAKTYMLLGSSGAHEKFRKKIEQFRYRNSAFLIYPGRIKGATQKYDKIRLIPFGEYIPLKGIIPWSYINVPKIGEDQPGEKFTIFEMPAFRFAVTICWENIFPNLFRQFAKRGAQFMINITNEAWFGKTAAPYQFLSMNVFRAVENRLFVVRCANTGVSCFIDPNGRVVDRVKDANGQDTFVRGVLTGSVIPAKSNTFYTQYGDWLVWLSILFTAGFLITALRKKNLNPR